MPSRRPSSRVDSPSPSHRAPSPDGPLPSHRPPEASARPHHSRLGSRLVSVAGIVVCCFRSSLLVASSTSSISGFSVLPACCWNRAEEVLIVICFRSSLLHVSSVSNFPALLACWEQSRGGLARSANRGGRLLLIPQW